MLMEDYSEDCCYMLLEDYSEDFCKSFPLKSKIKKTFTKIFVDEHEAIFAMLSTCDHFEILF